MSAVLVARQQPSGGCHFRRAIMQPCMLQHVCLHSGDARVAWPAVLPENPRWLPICLTCVGQRCCDHGAEQKETGLLGLLGLGSPTDTVPQASPPALPARPLPCTFAASPTQHGCACRNSMCARASVVRTLSTQLHVNTSSHCC